PGHPDRNSRWAASNPAPRQTGLLGGEEIHPAGPHGNGSIMIPAQSDRARLDFAHHGVNGESGVSAITDIVAKKDKMTDTGAAGVRERGLKRLAVGVNVAEKSDPH